MKSKNNLSSRNFPRMKFICRDLQKLAVAAKRSSRRIPLCAALFRFALSFAEFSALKSRRTSARACEALI